MSLPSTIANKTALNLSGATPVFNLTDLTPYNTEGITLNNVSGSFTIVNPQNTTVYSGSGDIHYFAITSITQAAGIATVTTTTAHGLATGDTVMIGTATESGYNISGIVTVTGTNTFTYLVASGTSSPATGTPRGLNVSLNSIQIPLDASTNMPILGSYTITQTIVISGGTEAGTYTKSFIYNNAYSRPLIGISQSVNCFIARIVSTDTTTYTVNGIYPTLVRTQTIVYPSASGLPNTTSTAQRVQIDRPKVWNGYYSTTVNASLSYTFTDNLIVIDAISGSKTFEVSCQDICNINCCLNDANKAYINSLALAGEDSPRTQYLLGIFTRALQLAQMFKFNIECGNTTDASTNMQDILNITGCTADCNCGTSGEVVPYDGFIGKTILEWDVTQPNSQGDYINFNNYLYKVLNNTLVGYSPTLNPTFYQILNVPIWGTITGTLSNQTDLQTALNGKVDTFNVLNTASGATSVTINKKSGRVTFTDGISGNDENVYTINNSLITANSSVRTCAIYPMADPGNFITAHVEYGNGFMKIAYYNNVVQGTNGFSVDFQIM